MWRVARQRRAAKMRILRKEICWRRVDIGEVAAATAGDADFFAELVIMVEQQHRFAALARVGCAHHAGRTGADDDDIKNGFQRRVSL